MVALATMSIAAESAERDAVGMCLVEAQAHDIRA
jgi:hypothetical protein